MYYNLFFSDSSRRWSREDACDPGGVQESSGPAEPILRYFRLVGQETAAAAPECDACCVQRPAVFVQLCA